MHCAFTVCRVVAVFLFSTALAFAQIGTSTITGRVSDPSGAVVPNVAVEVVQVETNFKFSALTNSEGLYRVQSLQPGIYRITFELQGFKRLVRENVDLRTGDTLAVDVVLQLGEIGESIEVTGQTQLLETETSASGAVVEGEFLYKMPLYQ
ncbi:MAG: carboxypeptidase-like regulatory domain-containing protein, partial [Pyrinomonadaceae bacterium]